MESRPRRRKARSGHTLNEEAFDNITDDAAYWVGFLMADGCVYKNRVTIHLKESDLTHLEKFRTFVGGSQKISLAERPLGGKVFTSYFYSFNSDKVVARLAELGVTARKSFSATPPPELLDNRHFWRGVVDGDGCLGVYPNHAKTLSRLQLVGARNVVDAFGTFASQFLEQPVKTHPARNIFTTSVNGTAAARLVALLYTDATTALDRKAVKAAEIRNVK